MAKIELESYFTALAMIIPQPLRGARCDAANFTLPSPELKCGGSGYTFALVKIPEFYARFTIRISHYIEDGYVRSPVVERKVQIVDDVIRVVLAGNITFGTVGQIPWIRDQFGSANGTLTVASG